MSAEHEALAETLRAAGWIVTPPKDLHHGCFCDLESCKEGAKPDGCVIDQGRRSDCIYASKHERKEQCEYWRAWTPETLAEFWKEVAK